MQMADPAYSKANRNIMSSRVIFTFFIDSASIVTLNMNAEKAHSVFRA